MWMGFSEDAADIVRAFPVERKGALGSIRIARTGTVAISVEKLESHERVREVRYGAWAEFQSGGDLPARHRLLGEFCE
jgi:hypothetical protein